MELPCVALTGVHTWIHLHSRTLKSGDTKDTSKIMKVEVSGLGHLWTPQVDGCPRRS